jgi:hypothetical protein
MHMKFSWKDRKGKYIESSRSRWDDNIKMV